MSTIFCQAVLVVPNEAVCQNATVLTVVEISVYFCVGHTPGLEPLKKLLLELLPRIFPAEAVAPAAEST